MLRDRLEHYNGGEFDFSFHVLPALVGKMVGYEIRDDLRGIGTIASYQTAIKE